MVPYLSLLSMSTDCRIFQKMTVVDIVKKVFEPYKLALGTDKYKFLALTENGDKIKRRYCVQYRETDLDFVSRILAEEGIFYYFEHYEDRHVIVFGDNIMNYKDISSVGPIAFNGSNNMSTDNESVTNFDFSHILTPSEVAHSEYDFKKSSVKQKSTAKEESTFNLEVYDFPGNYLDSAQGEKVSKIRLESIKTFEKKADASSNSPRLSAGFMFKLDQGKDVQYLVTTISHGGSQPQVLEENASGQTSYSNGFVCIPATTIFRPLLHPKPVVTGLQSAVVVGPEGEEIYTDEHGRVKVQFHWDRLGKNDDKSSCWLRVAQAWGGGAWGAQFIPRIGDEVLVDFLEGDPDRPIVTGCVYNSDNRPINNPTTKKTQSGFRTKTHKGEGFNELRFDDATGAQEVYIHGEKDFKVTIKNNETKTIGNNLVNQVAKTATITAGEQLQLICGSASIVLDKSGKIVIHGGEVFVSGNTLHLDGKPIQMNMGGAAGIAAALIPAEAAAAATGGSAAPVTKAEAGKKKPEQKKVTKEDMKNADNKVTQTFGRDIPENKKTPSAFDRSALEDNKTFHENGGGEENAYYHPLWNKIHINSDKANIGTPIHEDLHYYSSKKFGETFGENLDEGTTEYFTRQLATNNRVGIYEDQYSKSVGIANAVGEQTLKDAYFKGDEKAISAIKKLIAPKTFNNYPVNLKELQTSYGL